MPKNRKHKRKLEATSALASFASTPWAIEPNALAGLFASLESLSAKGEINQVTAAARQMTVAGGVATIPITGAIRPREDVYTRYLGATACSQIVNDLNAALANPNVSKIVFVVDSPGGSVIGLEEAAQAIFQSRNKKPMVSVVVGMCASAAYYLASAAGKMIGLPSTSTGSIGSIMVTQSWVGYFEQQGFQVEAIHFGKHKADGNPYKKIDDQARASLQEWVDSYGTQFVAAVARHRGVTEKHVMDHFGQGKVFIAAKAKEVGLIDEVHSLQSASGAEDPAAATAIEAVEPTTVCSIDSSHTSIGLNQPTTLNRTYLEQIAGSVGDHFPTQPTSSSAATTPSAGAADPIPTSADSTRKEANVNPRIKAQLFALGLIESVDAEDKICETALKSFAAARGVAVPESVEDTIKYLTNSSNNAGSQVGQANPGTGGNETNPQSMTPEQYNQVAKNVRDAAALINMDREQALIDQEAIDTAVENIVAGKNTLEETQASWREKLSNDDQRTPVNKPAVTMGEAAADKFAIDAVSMMCDRAGYGEESERPQNGYAELNGMSLLMIAEKLASLHGEPLTGFTREDIALSALSIGGVNHTPVPSIHNGSATSFNRAGSFPNLLSNLAGKILDRAIPLADTTYARWTNKMMDVPDFKPKTILGVGSFDMLDELSEDEEPKQLSTEEELKGWIQAAKYGNKVGLTAEMLVDDDLDAFVQKLVSLAFAHENTLNRLCVELLTANSSLADNIALFHASHGNLVTSGGAPSQAQAKEMNLKHRKQTGIGTTKKIKSRPRIWLGPSDLEEEAKQTYLTMGQLGEVKQPTTDGNINTYRGSLEDLVVEPDLEEFSTSAWYTLDPRFRTIVHVFQSGYGRGGRRTSWFEPGRGTRYIKLEGRFGAAAVGYRGIVKNNG